MLGFRKKLKILWKQPKGVEFWRKSLEEVMETTKKCWVLQKKLEILWKQPKSVKFWRKSLEKSKEGGNNQKVLNFVEKSWKCGLYNPTFTEIARDVEILVQI